MAAKFTLGEVGDIVDDWSLDSESNESGGEEVCGYLGGTIPAAVDLAAYRRPAGPDASSDFASESDERPEVDFHRFADMEKVRINS